MKKIITVFLGIAIVLSLAGCGNSAKNNAFVKAYMAEFEASSLDLKPKYISNSELWLVGADLDKFAEAIQLLKNIGYEYSTDGALSLDEEAAIYMMQLWEGTNGNYKATVWLMLDITDNSGAHDYVKITYKPVE